MPNRSAVDVKDKLLADLAHAKSKHNTLRVIWALFTNEERFVGMQVDELTRSRGTYDIESKLRQLGVLHRPDTPEDFGPSARRERAHVLGATRRAFWAAAAVAAIAAVIAGMLGALQPSLPAHWGKVLQLAGGSFAVWGTLLAVDRPSHSWSGIRPAERAHTAVYTGLLCIGGALAAVGTLVSP